MGRLVRQAAVYFGFREPEDVQDAAGGSHEVRLVPLAGAFLSSAGLTLLLAALAALIVLVLFDWSAASVARGTAVGVALWGTLEFVWDVGPTLPGKRVADAPLDAVVERPRSALSRATLLRLLVVAPLLVGLIWFADRSEFGPVFVPGQLAGYGAARLAGAFIVWRWQKTHGARVLIGIDCEGPPFAQPPVSRSSAAALASRSLASRPR